MVRGFVGSLRQLAFQGSLLRLACVNLRGVDGLRQDGRNATTDKFWSFARTVQAWHTCMASARAKTASPAIVTTHLDITSAPVAVPNDTSPSPNTSQHPSGRPEEHVHRRQDAFRTLVSRSGAPTRYVGSSLACLHPDKQELAITYYRIGNTSQCINTRMNANVLSVAPSMP